MYWISYAILAGLGLMTVFYWRLRREKIRLEQLLKKRTTYLESLETELSDHTAHYNLELNKAQTIAEKANQAKSKFLGKMSHELRNPLYTILGYAQLLKRCSLNPQDQINLEQIRRSGEHLLSLINDVLEMVQLEANQLTLNETSFHLRCFLEAIETTLQPAALAKGLHLIFYLPSDVSATITADERKLRQVLMHLLDNGIKFTHTGGITLRIGIGDRGWILEEEPELSNIATYSLFFEIEDTGIGIAPELLEQVFDPFFPTQSHRDSQRGIGLGLSICQKLAQLMGGNISINSTLEQGTLVRFNVPVKPASHESWQGMIQPNGRIIGLATHQPNYRILIVDDRLENRHLLIRLLEPLGFQVQEAANGEEAISLWSTWQPHLIFIDTRMPVMSGYEAIQQIKRLEQMGVVPVIASETVKSTVIIALSTGTLEEEQADILNSGCDDILHKPFEVDIVLEKIAQYLGVRYLYETEGEDELLNEEEDDDDMSTIPLSELSIAQKNLRSQPLRPTSVQPLHAVSLKIMPHDWIVQMNYFACAGDSEQLYSLIEQIPHNDSTLNSGLKALVEQFNFRKLKELTQSLIDE